MDDIRLIVGLGNPGPQYVWTRHNIGFWCVDVLADRWGMALESNQKMLSRLGRGRHKGAVVLLAEPQTYMNRSGEAVVRLMNYYKVPVENILVVYDDIDLPLGKVRIRKSGSAGTHNGMRSLVQSLGRSDFPRLRVGIGPPAPMWNLADFVLAPFPEEQRQDVLSVARQCADAMALWVTEGTEIVMNRYNGKDLLPVPEPEINQEN